MKWLAISLSLILVTSSCWAGASRDFDGSGDALSKNVRSIITPQTGNISAAAWVNLQGVDDPSNDHSMVVTFSSTSSAKANFLFFIGAFGASGDTRTVFQFNDGSFSTERFSNSEVPLTGWHHIAFTYDGINIRHYLDGVLDATVAESGTLPSAMDTNETLHLGARQATTSSLDGLLSHAHYYERVLATEEVQEIMFLPSSIVDSIVSYWPVYGVSLESDLGPNNLFLSVTNTTVSTDGPPITIALGGL